MRRPLKNPSLAAIPLSPMGIMLAYRKKWAQDQARFKIGLWARQTGKSFSCAAEAVMDCFRRPGTQWIGLGAGERQALEFMRKGRDRARGWIRQKTKWNFRDRNAARFTIRRENW